MRAAGALIAAALVAAALGSCSWGTFDDLKKDAWVQLVERDDSETGGDFGLEVTAMPPASGADGIRFVISVGNPPAGLAQATFNAKGDLTEQIGFDAEMGGKGRLEPLRDSTPAFSLVPYDGESFLAGAPSSSGAPGVIKYKMGLENGLQLTTDPRPNTGRTVVVGNLGLGSTNPDIVALGILTLTIIPNGDKTPIVCDLKPPNPASSAGGHPVVAAESLILARLAGDFDHIVVSADDINNENKILVIKASDVRNGMPCPENLAFPVTGFMVGNRKQGPVAIAAGDIDGNGKIDLVTGSLVSGGGEGVVTAYLDVTPGTAPAPVVIPIMDPEKEDASGARGARLRIANIDETPANEIIVSDSGASAERNSLAGRVHIYRWGACGTDGGAVRGPACLVRTLFDPTPNDNDQFGRALAIGKFKSSKGEQNILAIAEKAKLWVYFQTSATGTDPRD